MDCCGASGATPEPSLEQGALGQPAPIGRRSVIKGGAALAASAGALSSTRGGALARGKTIQLGFCSQILCAPPYEVTRAGGFFRDEGLDVELIYMRGSPASMQALVGGAIDYSASAFDDLLLAANRGADIRRFFSTALVPLIAIVVAPNRVAEIKSLKDLEGHTVGVGALPSTIVGYLIRKAGGDPSKVKLAVIGQNAYDAVRLGQVDAAFVQEPALSLLVKQGARVLVNLMETDDAEKYLGGRYEFMGVSVRTAEIAQRREEMQALARALTKGLAQLQSMKAEEVTAALPKQLVAGGDVALLTEIIAHYRAALYPTVGTIDLAACQRAADALRFSNLIRPDLKPENLVDLSFASG